MRKVDTGICDIKIKTVLSTNYDGYNKKSAKGVIGNVKENQMTHKNFSKGLHQRK